MAGERKKVLFSELCDITRGASPRPIHDWIVHKGTPWVKISDATSVASRFVNSTSECIRSEGERKSVVVYPGDLILSNSATPGIPRFMGIKACIHDGWLLLRNFRGLHKEFAYYLLLQERQKLVQLGNGSVFTNLKTEILKNHEVEIPPLAEQRRIAEILGSLDDKIELNRKMNKTLEEMARALFKSWFVDFDPVRAKSEGRLPSGMDAETAALFPSEFEDSELGPIPKGWEAGTLGDVIEVFDSKRIPLSGREREQRQGSYPYYGAAAMMDSVDDYIFDGIYVLMGEDGSVVNEDGTPVLQYVWGKFWVNNHAHVLQGKLGVCTEHLWLNLKDCNIAGLVTGAVQPKLNQANMNRIPCIIPSKDISVAFSSAVAPMFTNIRSNTEQSNTISVLRDSLLPKLLMGELGLS